MNTQLIGEGVSFKKIDRQMVSDIRDLQETGSISMSIMREQDMLERVQSEKGEISDSIANLL